MGFSGFADLAGRSREIVNSLSTRRTKGSLSLTFSRFLTLSHSLSFALSLDFSLSRSLALSLSRSLTLRVFTTKMQLCQASRRLLER